MIRTSTCTLFVAVLFFSSCAPKRSDFRLNTTETSSDELVRMVAERGKKLSSVVGRGIVSFDSPELSGSASFHSTMKKPDSLLLTLSGPFGIDVGTFFLSKDQYIMYNSLENSVITGNPNGASVRSVIPFDLSAEQILNVFAGVFAVTNSANELQSYNMEDELFVLTYSCGTNRCTYWIDPNQLLVTKYEMRDPANELLIEAKASAFTQQDDVTAARRVSVKFPKQQRQVSVAYNSMKLNATETDFSFTIPSSAKRIER
jgi:hypothetical protein